MYFAETCTLLKTGLEITSRSSYVVPEKDGEDQSDRSCKQCEVMYKVKKEVNILNTVKLSKANGLVTACLGALF